MIGLGKDRVELMKSLSIEVLDKMQGDNLFLKRYGVEIPYNMGYFVMYSESVLVTDVLRRFREKQMDVIPDGDSYHDTIDDSIEDNWKKLRHESNLNQMSQYLEENKPKYQYHENNIVLKKKIIRDKLIEKGLMCSES